MTPISISTYSEGEYHILKISYRDWVMRRDVGVEGIMTKSRILELIKELQELIK